MAVKPCLKRMLADRKTAQERSKAEALLRPPEPPDKNKPLWWQKTENWPEPPCVPVSDRMFDEGGFQKYFGWEVAHGHLPEVQARLKDPEPELVGFEDKEADPDGFATYLAWAYR